MIEFIVLAVTLAVPLAYLVLAVFDIQRAAYGANSATREAARVFVLAPSTAQAEQQARDAAQVALADQGLSVSDGSFTISCSASPCLTPGARVQVSFRTLVRLPLLPGFVAGDIASVPVSASHTETVDVYAELRP
ncbi:MAG: pilus assembly protein [Candidatus Nanopelagicales bacterium]